MQKRCPHPPSWALPIPSKGSSFTEGIRKKEAGMELPHTSLSAPRPRTPSLPTLRPHQDPQMCSHVAGRHRAGPGGSTQGHSMLLGSSQGFHFVPTGQATWTASLAAWKRWFGEGEARRAAPRPSGPALRPHSSVRPQDPPPRAGGRSSPPGERQRSMSLCTPNIPRACRVIEQKR